MSRGHGSVQRAILAHLATIDEPIVLASLALDLYPEQAETHRDRTAHGAGVLVTRAPEARRHAVWRALRRLEAERFVESEMVYFYGRNSRRYRLKRG